MKRLALILILTTASPLLAQEPAKTATATTSTSSPAGTTTSTAAVAVVEERRSAEEIRSSFSRLLEQTGSQLPKVLALDPTLLSNQPFLADYPEVAQFIAAHPEIRRNPAFYLAEYAPRPRTSNVVDQIMEPIAAVLVMIGVMLTVSWLIRTIIEQKRWNRLSRTQSEVHTKILDRFGTTAELLEYIRTPAGTKFLESAPIPLHESRGPQNAPLTRIMWSVQIGVIVAAGAIGMLLVSTRLAAEGSEVLFALGAISLCIGGGFIASAIVSVIVAKRLGMWEAPGAPTPTFDDSASMR